MSASHTWGYSHRHITYPGWPFLASLWANCCFHSISVLFWPSRQLDGSRKWPIDKFALDSLPDSHVLKWGHYTTVTCSPQIGEEVTLIQPTTPRSVSTCVDMQIWHKTCCLSPFYTAQKYGHQHHEPTPTENSWCLVLLLILTEVEPFYADHLYYYWTDYLMLGHFSTSSTAKLNPC